MSSFLSSHHTTSDRVFTVNNACPQNKEQVSWEEKLWMNNNSEN
ncbi:hypothetical protein [Anaerobiospirillum succiniciproducens]